MRKILWNTFRQSTIEIMKEEMFRVLAKPNIHPPPRYAYASEVKPHQNANLSDHFAVVCHS